MPNTFPVSVFLHHGSPERLQNEKVDLTFGDRKSAEAVTRAFFSGMIHRVWKALPSNLQARIRQLGIEDLATSGAVSAHADSLRDYAPDLLS